MIIGEKIKRFEINCNMKQIQISKDSLNILRNSKNLFAFSGGVDSSALFYILLENNIKFDMAIVDYNLRKESKDEVAYAKSLAEYHSIAIYVGSVALDKFSENEARDVRYIFFKQIIEKHKYKHLITAHQLNDKLEWFFMQFSKGAGLLELTGMGEFENRDGYKIIRPLIDISKNILLEYLNENGYKYFIDASNFDEKYKRNYFRHNFTNRFIEEFGEGVTRSLKYLEEDRNSMLKNGIEIESFNDLYFFDKHENDRINIFYIDRILKRNGYIISSGQRDEIINNREVVVAGEWVVAIGNNVVYISPYRNHIMTKDFKESCRIRRIPQLVRPYLYEILNGNCENI